MCDQINIFHKKTITTSFVIKHNTIHNNTNGYGITTANWSGPIDDTVVEKVTEKIMQNLCRTPCEQEEEKSLEIIKLEKHNKIRVK